MQRELYERLPGQPNAAEPVIGSLRVSGPGGTQSQNPIEQGGSRLKARPAIFDGKTSFEGYLIQYGLICDLSGCDESERARYLAASLSGAALSVLANMSAEDRCNYQQLVNALSQRFSDNRSSELACVTLENRRKQPNESLAAYASDIETLVRDSFSTLEAPSSELLAREKFVNGLDNAELRRLIKLHRCSSLADALNFAMESEAILLAESQTARNSGNRRQPFVQRVQQVSSSSGHDDQSGDSE